MTPSTAVTELAGWLVEQIAAQVQADLEARGATGRQPLARLLTAEQAGEYIGRSAQAVRHMIFQRDIPVVRSGRCVRIDRKDLDIWIENNKR